MVLGSPFTPGTLGRLLTASCLYKQCVSNPWFWSDQPIFLVFERHAPSPEIIPNDLSPAALSRNAYAEQLVSRLCEAQKQFNTIKADLQRTQGEYYHKSSRDLAIPEEKELYVRRPSHSSQP